MTYVIYAEWKKYGIFFTNEINENRQKSVRKGRRTSGGTGEKEKQMGVILGDAGNPCNCYVCDMVLHCT